MPEYIRLSPPPAQTATTNVSAPSQLESDPTRAGDTIDMQDEDISAPDNHAGHTPAKCAYLIPYTLMDLFYASLTMVFLDVRL